MSNATSGNADGLIVRADGSPLYGMGLVPSPADKGGLPRYSASNPTIPRSEWKPISFKHVDVPILNQGQHGSCVGHGSCTAFWKTWKLGGGADHRFSPCWVYGLINGGRDAGASIVQALKVIEGTGVAFEEQVPEGMIYSSQFPPEAKTTAARFKAEGYVAHTLDELGSGLQLGFMPVYGVAVGGAFQSYRSGLIQVSWGPANHCVTADGMKCVNGTWVLDGINSWGTAWGDQGRFQIKLDDIAKDELFLLRFAQDDPQETDLPPRAKA